MNKQFLGTMVMTGILLLMAAKAVVFTGGALALLGALGMLQ